MRIEIQGCPRCGSTTSWMLFPTSYGYRFTCLARDCDSEERLIAIGPFTYQWQRKIIELGKSETVVVDYSDEEIKATVLNG